MLSRDSKKSLFMNCAIRSDGKMMRLLKFLLKNEESELDSGMGMVEREGLKNGKRCIVGQRTSGSMWPCGIATWVLAIHLDNGIP